MAHVARRGAHRAQQRCWTLGPGPSIFLPMSPGLRWLGLFAACAAATLSVAAAPITGRPVIRLSGALRSTGTSGTNEVHDLIIESECTSGRWRRDVFGFAGTASDAEHYGHLLEAASDGETIRLAVQLQINAPDLAPRAEAFYAIVLRRSKDGLTGSFRGRSGSTPCRGKAHGTVAPIPPTRDGFVPHGPGEHPRLLLRLADLSRLREASSTENGRRLTGQLRMAIDDPLAMAFAYHVTADAQLADTAVKMLSEPGSTTLPDRNDTRTFASRVLRLALAYDLMHDKLGPAARARFAALSAEGASLVMAARPAATAGAAPDFTILAGAYAAILATWDSPGTFATPPVRPAMRHVPAPLDPPSPAGVPAAHLQPGTVLSRWLFVGPFFARCGREDYLVSREADEGDPLRTYFQPYGQDFLAGVGGSAQVRPVPGLPVAYQGRARVFGLLPRNKLRVTDDGVAVDVWEAHQRVPGSAGYYYTILHNRTPGWFQLLLEPPESDADPGQDPIRLREPFRMDIEAILNGVLLHHRDLAYLERGTYPLMVRATTRGYGTSFAPRLIRLPEAEARHTLQRLGARFERERAAWSAHFAAPMRAPLVSIVDRKVVRGIRRYGPKLPAADLRARRAAALLAVVYENVTGIGLRVPELDAGGDPVLDFLRAAQ